MHEAMCIHKMEDLQKRHNGINDDFSSHGHDGSDAFGVEDLHTKKGQGEVGSGLELERSLEQVAAREAWLNEQSQLPVENWLTGVDGADFGTYLSDAQESVSRPRALLVIDARSNQWEPLSTHLPDNTDLLLIDSSQSGLEQVESSVRFAQANGISYEAVALVASRSAEGEVCLGRDSFKADETGLSTKVLNELDVDVLSDVRLRLFADPPMLAGVDSELNSDLGSLNAVAATVSASANELLIDARLNLRTAVAEGNIEVAIDRAFDAANRGFVFKKLDDFLNGKTRPQIDWASFEKSNVQGAFIKSTNTILISEELKENKIRLHQVVLEEIGHWLEADSELDSVGDEGSLFSQGLSGEDQIKNEGQDQNLLLINGDYFAAEFSEDSESPSTDTAINEEINDTEDESFPLNDDSPETPYTEGDVDDSYSSDDDNHFGSDNIEDAKIDLASKKILLEFDPPLKEISGADLVSLRDDIDVFVDGNQIPRSSIVSIGHEDIPYSARSRFTIALDDSLTEAALENKIIKVVYRGESAILDVSGSDGGTLGRGEIYLPYKMLLSGDDASNYDFLYDPSADNFYIEFKNLELETENGDWDSYKRFKLVAVDGTDVTNAIDGGAFDFDLKASTR